MQTASYHDCEIQKALVHLAPGDGRAAREDSALYVSIPTPCSLQALSSSSPSSAAATTFTTTLPCFAPAGTSGAAVPSLPTADLAAEAMKKSLRRSTAGPYALQDPDRDSDSDDTVMDGGYHDDPSLSECPVRDHATAPYDSVDPEILKYCQFSSRLPSSYASSSSSSSSSSISSSLLSSSTSSSSAFPFSSSNSPISASCRRGSPVRLLGPFPVSDSSFLGSSGKSRSVTSPTLSSEEDYEVAGRYATQQLREKGEKMVELIVRCSAPSVGDSATHLSRENRARLTFLKDTVDLFQEYLKNQLSENMRNHAYITLLNIVSDQLEQTLSMITRIVEGTTSITSNFDIFELTLRRSYSQLTQMFPPVGQPNAVAECPSLLIQDPKGRKLWEDAFGPFCSLVTFDTFLKEIVIARILQGRKWENDDHFQQSLRYFLNFPIDNVVTTYKWHTLIQLFGPFDQFVTNFCQYGLGQGFLGLTNRINAFEILSIKKESRIFLIRLSRTEPNFLAFSYKNSRGEIGHQVNKGKDGQPIPILQFLQQRFPGYSLVPERLDLASILGKANSSLCEYADGLKDYIL